MQEKVTTHRPLNFRFTLAASALLAATVTFLDWAALHWVPQKERWHWFIYPSGILGAPGSIVAVILAALLSPQGFHGVSDYESLVSPVNFIFYFFVFLYLLRRLSKQRAT
jgi:hypothetical protein